MALELIKTDPDYADIATQFFRHFLLIAENGSQPTNKAGKFTFFKVLTTYSSLKPLDFFVHINNLASYLSGIGQVM